MFCKRSYRIFLMFLLLAGLALSGCMPLIQSLIQPVTSQGTAPTPIVSVEKGGVDNPQHLC